MDNELTPYKPLCQCGQPASVGLVIGSRIHGADRWQVSIPPMCAACATGLYMAPASLPTHETVQVQRVTTMPVGRGEVLAARLSGPIVLGCPQCGATVSLQDPPFRIVPSFVCPACDLHAWLECRD